MLVSMGINIVAAVYFLLADETSLKMRVAFLLLTAIAFVLQFEWSVSTHFLVPLAIQIVLSVWAVLVWKYRDII